jgi:hypothetical protein
MKILYKFVIMIMKKILFATLILSSLFIGCSKDDTDDVKQPTKTELLTAHYWQTTALTIDPPLSFGGTSISDIYAQLDNCEKDNIEKYNTNNTIIFDEGATKCDPADPQTQTLPWSFNSDETILTVDGESYKVLTLTSTQLKVSISEVIGGVNYTITSTYAKK